MPITSRAPASASGVLPFAAPSQNCRKTQALQCVQPRTVRRIFRLLVKAALPPQHRTVARLRSPPVRDLRTPGRPEVMGTRRQDVQRSSPSKSRHPRFADREIKILTEGNEKVSSFSVKLKIYLDSQKEAGISVRDDRIAPARTHFTELDEANRVVAHRRIRRNLNSSNP